jgi:amino acid transporter
MIVLALKGIRASLRIALVLFALEVGIVVLLAIIVVGHGGRNGLSLHPLSPDASPHGFHGLATGFVFAALSFVGFEAAATLGEEVREPRRLVPRAILLSSIAVGLIYVFCVWAEVNGLGAEATRKLDGASMPWNDLAAEHASWVKWPVIVASASSMFAVMINGCAFALRDIVDRFAAMGLSGQPRSARTAHGFRSWYRVGRESDARRTEGSRARRQGPARAPSSCRA